MDNKNLEIKQILSLAIENHQKKNFKLAEDLYKKILTKDSNHFQSLFLLGTLFAQIKDYNKSITLLNKAVEIQPYHADSYHNLGSALSELGEFNKSIEILKKVIQIDPKHPDAYYNLGNAYKQIRDFPKAKKHYEKAIQLQPKNTRALNNLGNVLKELGDLKDAIKTYKKVIQIQPNHARSYHNLGNAFKQLGEFEKAKDSYYQAFNYQPSNLETLDTLSVLDEKILDLNLKGKINEVMSSKNLTQKDIAYGNFLLAKYELQQKNFDGEFEYLLKGHSHYFDFRKKIFQIGVKYWLNDLPKIKELVNYGQSIVKKNESKFRPIFIVGVPRCGSTLIEKIIASGPQNVSIGEETSIISLLVGEEITKKGIFKPDIENFKKKVIEKYEEKKLIKKENNYIFTDKTLDNFFFIGLIKEIFPLAKIINCKRSSLSSIVSILKNNLGDVSWAHDLEHIFKFFDNYHKKIHSFKKIFPNLIYDLNFENFVQYPELESKKLMKFCELPWNKKCLEFYKRKDLISNTASNIQIRKAIYKDEKEKNIPYKQFLKEHGKKYSWFS